MSLLGGVNTSGKYVTIPGMTVPHLPQANGTVSHWASPVVQASEKMFKTNNNKRQSFIAIIVLTITTLKISNTSEYYFLDILLREAGNVNNYINLMSIDIQKALRFIIKLPTR